MNIRDKYAMLLRLLNLDEYYTNGYLGQGVTIASFESISSNHGKRVQELIKTYAPNCTFLSNDSNMKISEYVDYCIANNVDILTISLAIRFNDEERKALTKLYENGIIYCQSADNNDKEITLEASDYARSIDKENVCVSGVTYDFNKNTWKWNTSDSCNYGNAVDVVTESVVPVVSNDTFSTFTATSASTPLIASMIAILKSTGFKITSRGIQSLIELYSEEITYKDRVYNLFILPSLKEVLESGDYMIKTYSYKNNKDTKLSEHFTVGEFKSHCNGTLTTDIILINEQLPVKLEELMKALNSTKAVITSGYRDKTCDIKVGGSGVGQHVNGNAVDIIFYDSSNNVIDTKIVSCKAQDLGFTGIARISNSATHLDVRTNGKYYGDEMTGHTNTVTSDFYSYYGITKVKEKSDVEKAIDKLVEKEVISSGDYWLEHVNDIKYLDSLLIKIANRI